MGVTIKDIARAASVSTAAVSLAINNRPGISEKTRSKIRRIAKELHYIPNLAARSLISQRSLTIGVIITDITDPFYPQLARSIEETADERGYSMILCNSDGDFRRERHGLENLMGKQVDGIILSSTFSEGPAIDLLVEKGFPFVFTNRIPVNHPLGDDIDYVIIDNYAGGYRAVEHLYRIGHDKIAIIAAHMTASNMIERARGARSAMKEYGMHCNPDYFITCEYSRRRALLAAKGLLAMKDPPTAFFVQDDNLALGVREAILSSGARIPEDVGLVGFDDIDFAGVTGVELTTVSHRSDEMGTLATEILINKIENSAVGTMNKIVLEAELIIRKTCGHHLKGYVRP